MGEAERGRVMLYIRGAAREARDAEIARRFAAGDDIARIAHDLGLAESSVRVYAWRMGAKRPRKPRATRGPDPAKQDRNREIVERYAGGEPVQLIAADFGLSPESVRGVAARAGVRRGAVGRSVSGEKAWGTTERNNAIRELHAAGAGYKDIADRFGISRQRVEQIIRTARHRARRRAQRLKTTKQITPPDFCALCGGKGKLETHHPRYEAPDVLTWLCHDCHAVADVCRRRRGRMKAA